MEDVSLIVEFTADLDKEGYEWGCTLDTIRRMSDEVLDAGSRGRRSGANRVKDVRVFRRSTTAIPRPASHVLTQQGPRKDNDEWEAIAGVNGDDPDDNSTPIRILATFEVEHYDQALNWHALLTEARNKIAGNFTGSAVTTDRVSAALVRHSVGGDRGDWERVRG